MNTPYPPSADEQQSTPPSWTRRFARSTRDRKVAGVAGGIGRALGIDPVLIRVAFVILTVFGTSGVGVYTLAWLVLASDRDEVSPLEALIGRGRSSVPAIGAIALGIAVLISLGSAFTWGLPLLPIAIAAFVVFVVMGRKRQRISGRPWQFHNAAWHERFGPVAAQVADEADQFSKRAGAWGEDLGRRAEDWSKQFSERAQAWGASFDRRHGMSSRSPKRDCSSRRPLDRMMGRQTPATGSPFERPAFWDDPSRQAQIDLTKRAAEPSSVAPDRVNSSTAATGQPAPETLVEPTAPPAWDPLGAAPFAWDLPEPGPAPISPEEQHRDRRGRAFARATAGIALVAAAFLAFGLSAGWWDLNWAIVSGSALAVVAAGVIVAALRGYRSRLIGFGILLSIVTAFLTMTGINGTGDVGEQKWKPLTASDAAHTFHHQLGNAVLDLTAVPLQPGEVLPVGADLNTGDLMVLVPDDVAVVVTCSANVGDVECLDLRQDGFNNKLTASSPGKASGDKSEIRLTAHVGIGKVTVTHG